jgi:hypothetical protein
LYWLNNHSTTTINTNAEKFCVNCIHFKKHWLSSTTFGRCVVFPKESENKIDYLISGKPEKEFKFCSTTRKDEKNILRPKEKYFQKKYNIIDQFCIKKNKNNKHYLDVGYDGNLF